MKRNKLKPFLFMILVTIVALTFYQGTCFAQEEEEQKPERLVTMAVEYPGIELPAGEDVEMDIFFHNKGKSDENIDVWVAEAPEGWETVIKTYKFTVTGVHVPSGENKTL